MKFNNKELKNYTKAELINIILGLRNCMPDESPIWELFE